MKILFIGSYIPDNIELEYKNYLSVASNKFQGNFINNFRNIEGEVEILSYIQYPLFPKGKKVIVSSKYKDKKNISFIRYINLPIIKEISIFISTLLFIIKNNKKYKYILTYNLFLPYLTASMILKHLFKYKLGSIIADLYIDDYYYENIIKRVKKKIVFKYEIKLLSKLDFCIPITEKIVKDFEFKNPYKILEGGVNNYKISPKNRNLLDDRKIISYTGAIDSVNGIEMLIEVIKLIDSSRFKFNIAGDGPLLKILQEKIGSYDNVSILGKISNEEAINIQKNSDLLILLRPKHQKITRYTFPSKLHEYMNAEVPVLITNLEGINKEYYNFINIIKYENARYIIKQIEEIFSDYNYYKKKAINAREYVIKNKNWNKQVEGIIEFIKRI